MTNGMYHAYTSIDEIPSNGYSGICDFTTAKGMHERVVWRLRRANRRTKRGYKRGHIIFLEVRVNDHTTLIYDEGYMHYYHMFSDKTTKDFFKLLVSQYN